MPTCTELIPRGKGKVLIPMSLITVFLYDKEL